MIKVENLSKSFGGKRAVDDVSFEVQPGEVLGFLGPNGAGKSTTMRMITGFIPPSEGRISICGHDMLENPIPAKQRIGYLPESAPSYGEMTVVGFLKFTAELRGLSGEANRKAVRRAVDLCFLETVLGQTIDTLSKGFRHRTCFAQALIHDPDVLVLDEPTDGLDPNQKHEMRTLIRSMGKTKAIIFSTHILEEVDAVCSRAIIIDRGRLVANGTPAELRSRSASAGAVTARVRGVAAAELVPAIQSLDGIQTVVVITDAAGGVTVRAVPRRVQEKPALILPPIAGLLATRGWKYDELHVEEGRLDEFFRAVTVPDTAREEKV